MTYGPPITKVCEYCKEEYKCPNHRANKAKFCTLLCGNKSRRMNRVEYTCGNCNDIFLATPDHGKDRKFCSKKCWLDSCIRPIEKECKNCGCIFTATRSSTAKSEDGRRLYCSKKCHVEGSRTFEDKPCAYCGNLFYPIGKERADKQMTCSIACSAKFYSGANNHSFKGGTHIEKFSNRKMVLVGKREGFVSVYIAEHRLKIAEFLGRILAKTEFVIHINGDGLDNRLSNLYLCESISEYSRRRNGSLEWPKESNLEHYKEASNATDTVG